MIAAPMHRFTVEEYHRIAEVGILQEDDRVELLDGIIVDMQPIGPFHGGSVNHLAAILHELARKRWITSTQNPVHLNTFSEPEPDIVLLRPRTDFYRSQHPMAADVFLLIEVADSTLLTDREEKLPLYAKAGVPEVWIVNLPERVIEAYASPANGCYSEVRRVRPGEPLAPGAFPDASIDTAALLRS